MENLEKNLEDYPKIVTLTKLKKITEQIETCICKIYIDGKNVGTGFFCYLQDQNTKQGMSVMITNNHVLDDNYYNNNKEIKIEINKVYKDIKLDSKRKKYTDKTYDITIIEIIPKDKIKSFLEIDERIYLLDPNKIFQKTSAYVLQYPHIYDSSVSFGLIRNLDNNLLSHFCQTYNGSSGAPILNLDSNKVIGIHIGAAKGKFKYNMGTFLKNPINDFFGINKKDNININNEIKITLKIEKEDINKEIYFLDNTSEYLERNENKSSHNYLTELNENNTELYIGEKKIKYQKFFIPSEEGIYNIKLKFHIYIKDCSYMFYYCKNNIEIDCSLFKTQNVINMSNMFCYCLNLNYLDLSSFNTEKVINMSNFCSYCGNLTKIVLSSFKTDNVNDMRNMFSFCNKLTYIDISSFNASPNLNAELMFDRCQHLKTIKLNQNSKKIFLKFFKDNDGIQLEYV